MRSLIVAFALALPASLATAGVPPMTLPDLTFPSPAPDISTQGCSTQQIPAICKPAQ